MYVIGMIGLEARVGMGSEKSAKLITEKKILKHYRKNFWIHSSLPASRFMFGSGKIDYYC